MRQIAAFFALLLLTLCGCGKGSDPTRSPNDFVPVTSIRISAATTKIANNTSIALTVLGDHSGVFSSDVTSQAVLSCNDPSKADFVPGISNRIKAKATGDVVVTATFSGMTATFPLTISPTTIKLVTVTPNPASVAAGLPIQFAAQGIFFDNSVQDLTFDATWSATPGTGSASISNDPASKGLARGLSKGIVTITATFDTVSNSSPAQLTVSDPVLQSLTITPSNQSVDIFSTTSFGATGVHSDNTNAPVLTGLTWSSSNQNVATIVADTGVVTITGVGTTSIGVSSGTIIATPTNLTVKDFNLSFAATKSPMVLNEKVNFTVTATSVGGTTGQDVTTKCDWQSNATNIATVGNTSTDKGLVTAVAAGQATITATYFGKLITSTLTVTP